MREATEDLKLWLFDLAHDTGKLSNEKITQGFLKHYALHGLSMENVKQDIIFHTVYGAENCEYAMERLEGALKHFSDREESRTLTEVQMIVDAVRAGEEVCVEYYDPDDDDNEFVVRRHW